VAQVFGTSRLSYPFGYWNAVGAWAAMTAAVGVAWSANDQRPLPRALALATLPLSTTVAYLSFSRAALAGLALAAIAVLALSRHRWTALLHLGIAAALAMMCIESVRAEPQILHGTGAAGAYRVALMLVGTSAMGALGALATREARIDGWRVSRKVAVRISGAVAAAVVAVAAALGPSVGSRAWHQFHNPHVLLTGDPAQRLTSLSGNRYELWKAAMHAFGAHPLTGLGAGTFEFWWNRHATLEEFVRNAHSLWLESMAELGLPGLLSIVAVAATALALAFKVRRRALSSGSVAAATGATAALIVFLWQASVDWMWQSTAVTVFGLAAVAVLAGALIARAPRVSRRWRAGLVLAAAIAGAAQLPGLLSTAEVDRSQRALREGNAASALMWANASVSTEPWAASPHLQRGLVLEAAGRLRLAALELRRAIAREPDNFRHWVVLARIEKEARDTAQAGRDYARGQAMRPYTPLSGG
jgi:O-antigen ligase